jgi:hypothetical protein
MFLLKEVGGQGKKIVKRDTRSVANGTLGKMYIESTVAKNVRNCHIDENLGDVVFLHKKTIRRGESGCLNFLEKCVEDGTLVEGDLLLTDNEASFKTKRVLNI